MPDLGRPGRSDRKNKERFWQNYYRDKPGSSIPGMTGGQYVPNTSTFGQINGAPPVWQGPPNGALPGGGTWGGWQAPAATPTPAPTPVTSAQPGGYVPGGVPNLTGGYRPYTTSNVAPNVQTTAVPGPWSIPGTVAPTTNNQGVQQSAPANPMGGWLEGNGMYTPGYLGPGGEGQASPWFYNQSEYYNTLGNFASGYMDKSGITDVRDLPAGWYGSDGNRYRSLQDMQDAGVDAGVRYDPDYGGPAGGAYSFGNTNYQGGRRSWKGVIGDLIDSPTLDNQLAAAQQRLSNAQDGMGGAGGGAMGMMGLERAVKRLELAQKMRDKGWTFKGSWQDGAGGGVVSDNPTPGWMGQMVGFNP